MAIVHTLGSGPRPASPAAPRAASPLSDSVFGAVSSGDGLLLAVAMAGSMAAITTMSMVNLAVPEIAQQFRLAHGELHWVASAYLLAMASALPAAPWLVQRHGLRCVYGAALALLLAGALACAAAGGFGALLLGRVVQGLAAGVMQPVPLLLVQRCVPAPWRGRAAGVLGTATALAIALGPLAGGWLVQRWGWPAIFVLPLPPGVLGLLLLALHRRRATLRGPGTRAAAPAAAVQPPQRLDWPGLVAVGFATTGLLQGLALAAQGAGPQGLAAIALGAVAAIVFCLRQRSLAADGRAGPVQPLVSRALWSDRRYRASCAASACYGLLLNAFTYLLPLLLHGVLVLDAQAMGIVLLIAGLATVVVQPLAARQVDLRAHWPVLGVGFALLALALLAMPWVGDCAAAVEPAARLLTASGGALLCRVGLATALAALYVPAQRALAPALQAQGAMLSQFTQALGGVLGVGLAALALQWRMAAHAAGPAAHAAALHETFWLLAAVAGVAAACHLRRGAARPGSAL